MPIQYPTDFPNGLRAPILATVSQQSGTAYTFGFGDDYVQFTAAGAVTATVPPTSTTAFAIGTEITLEQNGAGQVTVVAGSGVTLRSAGGKVASSAQYAVATLLKVAVNTWTLFGNLA